MCRILIKRIQNNIAEGMVINLSFAELTARFADPLGCCDQRDIFQYPYFGFVYLCALSSDALYLLNVANYLIINSCLFCRPSFRELCFVNEIYI